MKSKGPLIVLILVLLVLAAGIGGTLYYFKSKPTAGAPAVAAAPAEQETVGVNAAVQNSVTLQGDADAAARAAEVGGPVRFLDLIQSQADSWLKVDLKNGREFSVGSNAQVRVDPFVYDPEHDAGDATLSVVKGVFRYASGGPENGAEAISLRTPTAAIGIRGTILEGAVGAEALELLATVHGPTDASARPEEVAVIVLRQGAIDLTAGEDHQALDRPNYAVAVFGSKLSAPFAMPRSGSRWIADRLPPYEADYLDPPPPMAPHVPAIPAVRAGPNKPVVVDKPLQPLPPPPVTLPPQPRPAPPPQPKTLPPPLPKTLPPPQTKALPQPSVPPPSVVYPQGVRPGAAYDPFAPTRPVAPPQPQPRPQAPVFTVPIPIPTPQRPNQPAQPPRPNPPVNQAPTYNPQTAPPLTYVPPPSGQVMKAAPSNDKPAQTPPPSTVANPQVLKAAPVMVQPAPVKTAPPKCTPGTPNCPAPPPPATNNNVPR